MSFGLNTIVGGILGGDKTSYDVQPLLDAINQSKTKQSTIASNLPGQLAPLNTQFSSGITGAENTAQTSNQAAAKNYMDSLGKSLDSQGRQLSDVLKQRVLQSQQESEQGLRENLAATGGLNRGAAGGAFTELAGQTANQIGQGEQAIAIQRQQAQQQALGQIYQMDSNFIQSKLGIDKDTLVALYSTGRQDLIDEANRLLGIESQANQDTLAALGAQQNADYAQSTLANNSSMAILQALGQAYGAYKGSKTGGSTAGSKVQA